MKEYVELRILEKYASKLLKEDEGIRLSNTVRKLTIETTQPLFKQIGEIDHKLNKEGEYFYLGWDFIRKYSRSELNSAKLFNLIITAVFEPSGEECGTQYDEKTACKLCQAGRKQISDLIIDLHKVPKKRDIARTIANEWVLSQRLAEILFENNITGFELRPIQHKGHYKNDPMKLSRIPSGKRLIQLAESIGIQPYSWKFYVWLNRQEQSELLLKASKEHEDTTAYRSVKRRSVLPTWYQLIVTSNPVPTVPPTKFGIKPFDEDSDGKYRCPFGHVSGLNLLSELWLSKDNWDGNDFCITKDMVGVRRGILVPSPMLIISPRLWRLLNKENIKGYKVEVAHLV